MKTLITFTVFIVAIVLSDDSKAQVRDLLVPINAGEESVARGENDYFIKKNTYWSKRHRIVKVDYSLLMDAKRFRIEFFDGNYIVVETDTVKREQDGKTIRWAGNIVEPSYSIEYLTNNGFSKEDANFIRPRLRNLSITASEVSLDPESKLKHQYFHDEFEEFRRPDGKSDGAFDVNATFNITPDLSKPTDESKPNSFATRYFLMPFDMELGYHLLFEEDLSKKYPGVTRDAETPEVTSKRMAYEEFVQSLGPNPAEVAREEQNGRAQ